MWRWNETVFLMVPRWLTSLVSATRFGRRLCSNILRILFALRRWYKFDVHFFLSSEFNWKITTKKIYIPYSRHVSWCYEQLHSRIRCCPACGGIKKVFCSKSCLNQVKPLLPIVIKTKRPDWFTRHGIVILLQRPTPCWKIAQTHVRNAKMEYVTPSAVLTGHYSTILSFISLDGTRPAGVVIKIWFDSSTKKKKKWENIINKNFTRILFKSLNCHRIKEFSFK